MMTAGAATILDCDQPGCVATFWAANLGIAGARENARVAGWTSRFNGPDSVDLCPRHPLPAAPTEEPNPRA